MCKNEIQFKGIKVIFLMVSLVDFILLIKMNAINVFYILSLKSFEDIQTKDTPLHKECFHSYQKPSFTVMTQEELFNRIQQHCQEKPNDCMHTLSIMVESDPIHWKLNRKLEDDITSYIKENFSEYYVKNTSFISKNSNISFTRVMIHKS